MSEKGLATIVVLAFNHERYIRQCLESVAGQTHRNLQIVFIDDGSVDGTFEMGRGILESAGARHVALQTKDNFICANLNLALGHHAKGEFFAVISGDDWWELDNVAKKVRFLDSHPGHPLVYSPMSYYYEKTGRAEPMSKPYAEGNVFERLLQENFIAAHAALVRTSIFAEVGYYDEASKIEDWDMWLRIAKSHEVGFIADRLGYYRIHDRNISGRGKLMLESVIHILGKHPDSEIARSQRSKLMIQYGVSYAPFADALRTLVRHGTFDRHSFRQFSKLLVRGLLPSC